MEQFAIGIASIMFAAFFPAIYFTGFQVRRLATWPKREPSPKIKVLSARFLVSLWFHACCFQNKIAQPSIRAGLPKSAVAPQLIR